MVVEGATEGLSSGNGVVEMMYVVGSWVAGVRLGLNVMASGVGLAVELAAVATVMATEASDAFTGDLALSAEVELGTGVVAAAAAVASPGFASLLEALLAAAAAA